MVVRLAERLRGLDLPREVPMSGAAGGLAGGLLAAFGARLEPGAPFVLDVLDFDRRMRAARAVITGEGRIDEQTLQGKVVGEIGTRTRQAGVPLHAIVGSNALGGFEARMIDLQQVREASTRDEIEASAHELGALIRTGRA
jgi:glycerate 2-kinase